MPPVPTCDIDGLIKYVQEQRRERFLKALKWIIPLLILLAIAGFAGASIAGLI